MLKLVTFASMIVVVTSSTYANWQVYKHKHNKVYAEEEDDVRRYIWRSNLMKIEQHNELFAQGKTSFYLGENHFADLTKEEFNKLMKGLRMDEKPSPGTFQSGFYKGVLPESVDWRTKGYVTPVKNQQQCGSCWAFSTTGSLEGQHFKATGQLVSLSESNLVDCSQKWGNSGCDGGLMDNAFQYIIRNKGINTENSYPYKPEEQKCHFKKSAVGANVTSYKDIEQGNEDALQKAVSEIGPISVAIDASQDSFQLYSGGVYDEPQCSSTELDHGVLLVGYGSEGGADYWIVKNSWGVSWGNQGYILMSRNKSNQCGIASCASYPVV